MIKIIPQPNEFQQLQFHNSKNLLIFSAGFEERCIAFLKEYSKNLLVHCHVIIINYPNINKEWQNEIADILEISKFSYEFIDDISTLANEILSYKPETIFVDISSMDRLTIFRVLKIVDEIKITYNIIYTEAEKYYPLIDFYNDLIDFSNKNYELAFDKYLEKENSPLVYSYDCNLFEDENFIGLPEPGYPVLLVSFFGFKRSRLQLLLQSLEVDKKIFILSEPLREDLKLRKDLKKIINFDLYQKNKTFVKELKTFNILESYQFLESHICENLTSLKYNVILSPLGSKGQTIACFYLWRNHKEIRIIFSLPKKFYPDKYSLGYRDTFIFTFEFLNKNLGKTWKPSIQVTH
jgi:hypothetical protein